MRSPDAQRRTASALNSSVNTRFFRLAMEHSPRDCYAFSCVHQTGSTSPAAKGRVERANQTLQDRLVKELRLRGISDRKVGNAYLPEFMADFNRRFAREPLNPHDKHRPLLSHEDLMRVFTWQEERRLTDNLTLHYKRVMCIVESSEAAESARKARVGHRIRGWFGAHRVQRRGTGGACVCQGRARDAGGHCGQQGTVWRAGRDSGEAA